MPLLRGPYMNLGTLTCSCCDYASLLQLSILSSFKLYLFPNLCPDTRGTLVHKGNCCLG